MRARLDAGPRPAQRRTKLDGAPPEDEVEVPHRDPREVLAIVLVVRAWDTLKAHAKTH